MAARVVEKQLEDEETLDFRVGRAEEGRDAWDDGGIRVCSCAAGCFEDTSTEEREGGKV